VVGYICHLVNVIFSLKIKTKRSLDNATAECQGYAKSHRGSLCFLCMTDLRHIFQASQKRGKDFRSTSDQHVLALVEEACEM